ncbi:hypothetical protein [Kineosporia sp. NBRC 101731]|uniref:hypothetical protein n=1 Tax=Kineosporia sp. NBRC 101731 TaxID=3032199 RepID=UPI0024A5C892|nr:hypothetical protein [Kineosporia sp. NBRC 101731]GLY29820.1 hypothetical protein Kisp02_31850 [Kineosporia sp. NBRC 101731]
MTTSSPAHDRHTARSASNPRPALTLAWGVNPEETDQNQVQVTTTRELTDILATIHAQALRRGVAQQIDIWEGLLPDPTINGAPGDPAELDDFLPEPFLQAVIGHPERAGLRWLGRDQQVQAIHPALPLLAEPVLYDNGGATDPMPPELLPLTYTDVEHILTVFLLHRTRADDVTWTDLSEIL